MKQLSQILEAKDLTKDHRNKYEFQAYGNMLADQLNDQEHRSLYIKLAKTEKRALLEQAREYVLASETATTKGKLFMWKLSQLKNPEKPADNKLPKKTK